MYSGTVATRNENSVTDGSSGTNAASEDANGYSITTDFVTSFSKAQSNDDFVSYSAPAFQSIISSPLASLNLFKSP